MCFFSLMRFFIILSMCFTSHMETLTTPITMNEEDPILKNTTSCEVVSSSLQTFSESHNLTIRLFLTINDVMTNNLNGSTGCFERTQYKNYIKSEMFTFRDDSKLWFQPFNQRSFFFSFFFFLVTPFLRFRF